ncbi:Centrin [Fasciola hepatica]|uniref:Centrin n=1 Tax=Fasciola hepatica TaxID=6192 RepID=A0A2H1CJG9_FASHE|nr:Centrin [Fasciola hepatica]
MSAAKQNKKSARGANIKLDLSKDQKQDILEAFSLLDAEGSGLIRGRDLKVALRALGFEPTSSELRHLILEYDKDNKGLDFKNFLDIMTKKMTDKDSREDHVRAFQMFDEEEKGYINFSNLKNVAKVLGEDIGDEEIQEMIDEGDKSGNGKVSEQEFLRLMRKTALL